MARLVNSGVRDPRMVMVNFSKMASRSPGVAQSTGPVNERANRPGQRSNNWVRRPTAARGRGQALCAGSYDGSAGAPVADGRAEMAGPDHSAGSRTTKRAPSTLGSLLDSLPRSAGAVRFSAQIVPPWPSTICLEIDSPRPEFWPKPCSSGRSV
jgi:hypothetical protein